MKIQVASQVAPNVKMNHSSILSECQLNIKLSWQLGLSPKLLSMVLPGSTLESLTPRVNAPLKVQETNTSLRGVRCNNPTLLCLRASYVQVHDNFHLVLSFFGENFSHFLTKKWRIFGIFFSSIEFYFIFFLFFYFFPIFRYQKNKIKKTQILNPSSVL